MRIGLWAELDVLAGMTVAGLDYAEISVADVLCPLKDKTAFTDRLKVARALPVPIKACNFFVPKELRTTGPDVDVQAVDRFVATACRRAAYVGVKVLVFGSAVSRMVPQGFDKARAFEQLAEHLRRWGPLASQAGVAIAVEALQKRECNILNTLIEGAELVRRVNHPSVRLLADTYHMASDDEDPEHIRQVGELLVHVHCADPAGRVPLGLGPANHRPYFRALKDVSYNGGVTIEAMKWDDFPSQLPAAVAALRDQIDSA